MGVEWGPVKEGLGLLPPVLPIVDKIGGRGLGLGAVSVGDTGSTAFHLAAGEVVPLAILDRIAGFSETSKSAPLPPTVSSGFVDGVAAWVA